MRLHSDILTSSDILEALKRAKDAEKVAGHVGFEIFEERGSRSRKRAFEIQLGTYQKFKGDKRGWKNSGKHGAGDVYAATWREWGFFIKELFEMDPELTFGHYKSENEFHRMTNYAFA